MLCRWQVSTRTALGWLLPGPPLAAQQQGTPGGPASGCWAPCRPLGVLVSRGPASGRCAPCRPPRPRLLPVPRASFERGPRGKRRTRPSLGFLLAPPCALSPAHKGSRIGGLGAPTSPRARAEEPVWDAPELQPGSAWPPPARAVFLGAPSSPGIPSEGASEWTFLFREMCLCAVSLRRLRAVQTLR